MDVIQLAGEDPLEPGNGVFQLHIFPLAPGKLFSHEKRLGKIFLHFSRSRHRLFILIGEFFHTQNGDDVLEVFVALQKFLHAARYRIVAFTDDLRVENSRVGIERIDGRINAQFRKGAREHHRRIQVSERRGRSWIRQVVSRYIHRLHRCDGAFLGRGDPLLQTAHLFRKRRLITDCGGNAPEERRNLRSRLRESENIIDKKQHVFPFIIAE